MRPVSLENAEQEATVHQFYQSVASSFEGYYKRLEYKFGPQTQFLGRTEDQVVTMNSVPGTYTNDYSQVNQLENAFYQ